MVNPIRPGLLGIINFLTRRNIQIAQETFSLSKRQLSSEKKTKGTTFEKPIPKTSSLILLGDRHQLVPSMTKARKWQQAMEILGKYLELNQSDKILTITHACISKFYQSRRMEPPMFTTVDELQKIFLEISNLIGNDGIQPTLVFNQDDERLNYPMSICATIVNCFAKTDFNSALIPKTVTEYYWTYKLKSEYLIPGVEKEHDLEKLIEMLLPHVTENTVYYELGIGAGEGLLEMLFKSNLQKTIPLALVGTDISPYALEIFKILIENGLGISINGLFLRHANASEPLNEIDLKLPPTRRLIIGANRFFSVLDEHSFQSVVDGLKTQLKSGDIFASGITIDSEYNMKNVQRFLKSTPSLALQPMQNGLGMFLIEKDPFKQQIQDGVFTSKDALIRDIHAVTKLPKDKIDVSKVVIQAFYDSTKYKDYLENVVGMKESKKESVSQTLHYDREVKFFEKH